MMFQLAVMTFLAASMVWLLFVLLWDDDKVDVEE